MTKPSGYLTIQEVAAANKVADTTVRHALRAGTLKSVRAGHRVFIKDIGADGFMRAFPIAHREEIYQKELLDRWLYVHDIRGIGERAVRETA